MREEWWLTAAVSDDRLVAELLLRLKDSPAASSAVEIPLLPTWGVRQPRSSAEKNKKRDARRRSSPTTPLSWVGGDDDSSADHHPQPSDRFRSKISASTDSPATSSKRHTRKKTFGELKEEECLLLKERTYLKKELATLRLTLVEQRSINNTLKRRKLDLPRESCVKSEANFIEPEKQNMNKSGASEATSSNASRPIKCEETLEEPDSCSTQQRGATSQEPIFVLPDLNMVPDEGCGQEGTVGMS